MYVKSIKSSVINAIRVDTLEVRFPRIILPEILTHRQFSRNFQSNRAKSIEKVINQDLTYSPTYYGWRKNIFGMSPIEFFNEYQEIELSATYEKAKLQMIDHALYLKEKGVAKEIVNRLLEPFMEVTGIITSTNWNNFIFLRTNHKAQLEIREVAKEIKKVLENTNPIIRDYHFPYSDFNIFNKDIFESIKQSVARCARVSYFSFDQKESQLDKDIELFNRLKDSRHLSPFEHLCFSNSLGKELFANQLSKEQLDKDLHGNLSNGIIQLRKLIELGVNI